MVEKIYINLASKKLVLASLLILSFNIFSFISGFQIKDFVGFNIAQKVFAQDDCWERKDYNECKDGQEVEVWYNSCEDRWETPETGNSCGQDNEGDGGDRQDESCEEDTWSDRETSGEVAECRDGKAGYRQWGRDSSCNIYSIDELEWTDDACDDGTGGGDNEPECNYQQDAVCTEDSQTCPILKDANGVCPDIENGACGFGENTVCGWAPTPACEIKQVDAACEKDLTGDSSSTRWCDIVHREFCGEDANGGAWADSSSCYESESCGYQAPESCDPVSTFVEDPNNPGSSCPALVDCQGGLVPDSVDCSGNNSQPRPGLFGAPECALTGEVRDVIRGEEDELICTAQVEWCGDEENEIVDEGSCRVAEEDPLLFRGLPDCTGFSCDPGTHCEIDPSLNTPACIADTDLIRTDIVSEEECNQLEPDQPICEGDGVERQYGFAWNNDQCVKALVSEKPCSEDQSHNDAVCQQQAGEPTFTCGGGTCMQKVSVWDGNACTDARKELEDQTACGVDCSQVPDGAAADEKLKEDCARQNMALVNGVCQAVDYQCASIEDEEDRNECIANEVKAKAEVEITRQFIPGEKCNYPETGACEAGTTKVCVGRRSDNGVCEYHPAIDPACSECLEGEVDVYKTDAYCSKEGKCLNGPGANCTSNLSCELQKKPDQNIVDTSQNASFEVGSKCESYTEKESCPEGQIKACERETNAQGKCEYAGGVCTECSAPENININNESAFCEAGKCVNGPGKACLTNDSCPQPNTACSFPQSCQAEGGDGIQWCKGKLDESAKNCSYDGGSCTACSTDPQADPEKNDLAVCVLGECIGGPGKACYDKNDCPQPQPPAVRPSGGAGIYTPEVNRLQAEIDSRYARIAELSNQLNKLALSIRGTIGVQNYIEQQPEYQAIQAEIEELKRLNGYDEQRINDLFAKSASEEKARQAVIYADFEKQKQRSRDFNTAYQEAVQAAAAITVDNDDPTALNNAKARMQAIINSLPEGSTERQQLEKALAGIDSKVDEFKRSVSSSLNTSAAAQSRFQNFNDKYKQALDLLSQNSPDAEDLINQLSSIAENEANPQQKQQFQSLIDGIRTRGNELLDQKRTQAQVDEFNKNYDRLQKILKPDGSVDVENEEEASRIQQELSAMCGYVENAQVRQDICSRIGASIARSSCSDSVSYSEDGLKRFRRNRCSREVVIEEVTPGQTGIPSVPQALDPSTPLAIPGVDPGLPGLDSSLLPGQTGADAAASGPAPGCDPNGKAIRYTFNSQTGAMDRQVDLSCVPDVAGIDARRALVDEANVAIKEQEDQESSAATSNFIREGEEFNLCYNIGYRVLNWNRCAELDQKVGAIVSGATQSIVAAGASSNRFIGDSAHNADCEQTLRQLGSSRGRIDPSITDNFAQNCKFDNRTPEQKAAGISADVQNGVDIDSALASRGFVNSGDMANKIKGIAAGVEDFDLKNPNANKSALDLFVGELVRSDPNATTIILETIGVPVTAIEKEKIAREICYRDVGAAVCDLGVYGPFRRNELNTRRPSDYYGLKPEEIDRINTEARRIFGEEFQPADPDKVKAYAAVRAEVYAGFNDPLFANDRRKTVAEKMGISMAELVQLEQTYDIWNKTVDQVLNTSTAGKNYGAASRGTEIQVAIGVVGFAFDGPDYLNLTGAAVKFLITKKGLQRMVGQNGIKSIDEAAEVVVRNGGQVVEADDARQAAGVARPADPVASPPRAPRQDVVPPAGRVVDDAAAGASPPALDPIVPARDPLVAPPIASTVPGAVIPPATAVDVPVVLPTTDPDIDPVLPPILAREPVAAGVVGEPEVPAGVADAQRLRDEAAQEAETARRARADAQAREEEAIGTERTEAAAARAQAQARERQTQEDLAAADELLAEQRRAAVAAPVPETIVDEPVVRTDPVAVPVDEGGRRASPVDDPVVDDRRLAVAPVENLPETPVARVASDEPPVVRPEPEVVEEPPAPAVPPRTVEPETTAARVAEPADPVAEEIRRSNNRIASAQAIEDLAEAEDINIADVRQALRNNGFEGSDDELDNLVGTTRTELEARGRTVREEVPLVIRPEPAARTPEARPVNEGLPVVREPELAEERIDDGRVPETERQRAPVVEQPISTGPVDINEADIVPIEGVQRQATREESRVQGAERVYQQAVARQARLSGLETELAQAVDNFGRLPVESEAHRNALQARIFDISGEITEIRGEQTGFDDLRIANLRKDLEAAERRINSLPQGSEQRVSLEAERYELRAAIDHFEANRVPEVEQAAIELRAARLDLQVSQDPEIIKARQEADGAFVAWQNQANSNNESTINRVLESGRKLLTGSSQEDNLLARVTEAQARLFSLEDKKRLEIAGISPEEASRQQSIYVMSQPGWGFAMDIRPGVLSRQEVRDLSTLADNYSAAHVNTRGVFKPTAITQARESLDTGLGSQFNAHALTRGTHGDNLRQLDYILTHGIDDEGLYTAPLKSADDLHFAENFDIAAYDQGGFMLISHPSGVIRAKDDIALVVVNEQFYGAIPTLQSKYPGVRFVRADEMDDALAGLANSAESATPPISATRRAGETAIPIRTQAEAEEVVLRQLDEFRQEAGQIDEETIRAALRLQNTTWTDEEFEAAVQRIDGQINLPDVTPTIPQTRREQIREARSAVEEAERELAAARRAPDDIRRTQDEIARLEVEEARIRQELEELGCSPASVRGISTEHIEGKRVLAAACPSGSAPDGTDTAARVKVLEEELAQVTTDLKTQREVLGSLINVRSVAEAEEAAREVEAIYAAARARGNAFQRAGDWVVELPIVGRLAERPLDWIDELFARTSSTRNLGAPSGGIIDDVLENGRAVADEVAQGLNPPPPPPGKTKQQLKDEAVAARVEADRLAKEAEEARIAANKSKADKDRLENEAAQVKIRQLDTEEQAAKLEEDARRLRVEADIKARQAEAAQRDSDSAIGPLATQYFGEGLARRQSGGLEVARAKIAPQIKGREEEFWDKLATQFKANLDDTPDIRAARARLDIAQAEKAEAARRRPISPSTRATAAERKAYRARLAAYERELVELQKPITDAQVELQKLEKGQKAILTALANYFDPRKAGEGLKIDLAGVNANQQLDFLRFVKRAKSEAGERAVADAGSIAARRVDEAAELSRRAQTAQAAATRARNESERLRVQTENLNTQAKAARTEFEATQNAAEAAEGTALGARSYAQTINAEALARRNVAERLADWSTVVRDDAGFGFRSGFIGTTVLPDEPTRAYRTARVAGKFTNDAITRAEDVPGLGRVVTTTKGAVIDIRAGRPVREVAAEIGSDVKNWAADTTDNLGKSVASGLDNMIPRPEPVVATTLDNYNTGFLLRNTPSRESLIRQANWAGGAETRLDVVFYMGGDGRLYSPGERTFGAVDPVVARYAYDPATDRVVLKNITIPQDRHPYLIDHLRVAADGANPRTFFDPRVKTATRIKNNRRADEVAADTIRRTQDELTFANAATVRSVAPLGEGEFGWTGFFSPKLTQDVVMVADNQGRLYPVGTRFNGYTRTYNVIARFERTPSGQTILQKFIVPNYNGIPIPRFEQLVPVTVADPNKFTTRVGEILNPQPRPQPRQASSGFTPGAPNAADSQPRVEFIRGTGNSVSSPHHPNQDTFIDSSHNNENLYAVFDGVSGHAGAAEASTIAQGQILRLVPQYIRDGLSDNQALDYLDRIFEMVNNQIHGVGGTTATVAKVFVNDQGQTKLLVGQVGDSAIFRLRGGRLERITADHGYDTPTQSIVTQSFGSRIDQRQIELFDVLPGDQYLITSDGVHDNISSQVIQNILSSDLRNKEWHIINAAVSAGIKPDDTTAVLITVPQQRSGWGSWAGAGCGTGSWGRRASTNSPAYLAQANTSNVLGVSTGEVLQANIACPLTDLAAGTPLQPAAELADDVVNGAKGVGDDLVNVAKQAVDAVIEVLPGNSVMPTPLRITASQADIDLARQGVAQHPLYGSRFGQEGESAYLYRDGDTVTKIFPGSSANFDGIRYINEANSLELANGQAGSAGFKGWVFDENGNLVGVREEFIDNAVTLTDFMKQGGTLTATEAEELLIKLRDLHQITGISHGDLTPNNIMIQTVTDEVGNISRRIRIIDYGSIYRFSDNPTHVEVDNAKKSEELLRAVGYMYKPYESGGEVRRLVNLSDQERDDLARRLLQENFDGDVDAAIEGLRRYSEFDVGNIDDFRSYLKTLEPKWGRDLKQKSTNIPEGSVSGRDCLVAFRDDVVTLAQVNSYVLGISKGPQVLAANIDPNCILTNLVSKNEAFKTADEATGGIIEETAGAVDNVLNVARNTVDEISSTITRTSGSSNPLSPPVPQTAFHEAFVDVYSRLQDQVEDLPIAALDNAARQVADEAQKFDYVIVTGKSGEISRSLLEKQGVSPSKFIVFDDDTNALIYQGRTAGLNSEATEILSSLTPQDRTELLRQALEESGIRFDLGLSPRFLIVDDHSDSGGKAVQYLSRFSEIPEVGGAGYASLVTRDGRIIKPENLGSGSYAGITQEQLDQFAKQAFVPSGLNETERERIFQFFSDENFGEALNYASRAREAPPGTISPEMSEYMVNFRDRLFNRLDPEKYPEAGSRGFLAGFADIAKSVLNDGQVLGEQEILGRNIDFITHNLASNPEIQALPPGGAVFIRARFDEQGILQPVAKGTPVSPEDVVLLIQKGPSGRGEIIDISYSDDLRVENLTRIEENLKIVAPGSGRNSRNPDELINSPLIRDSIPAPDSLLTSVGKNCELSLRDDVVNLAQVSSYVLGISKGPQVLAATNGPCGPIEQLIQRIPGLNNSQIVTQSAQRTDETMSWMLEKLGIKKITGSPDPILKQLEIKTSRGGDAKVTVLENTPLLPFSSKELYADEIARISDGLIPPEGVLDQFNDTTRKWYVLRDPEGSMVAYGATNIDQLNEGASVYISKIATDPAAKGNGYATAVLDAILEDSADASKIWTFNAIAGTPAGDAFREAHVRRGFRVDYSQPGMPPLLILDK